MEKDMPLWFLRSLTHHIEKCSLYTPRCAKQKPDPPDPANQHIAPEPPGKPHTIKCKLSTIIRDPTLLQHLNDVTERYNHITFEGAKVLQLYILTKLETGA